MFGISGFELLIILVFVLVIFGPDKLPELAKTMGRGIALFKKTQQDVEKVIRAEMLPDTKDLFSPSTTSSAATQAVADTTEAKPATAAKAVWVATSEDDEEEEDEE